VFKGSPTGLARASGGLSFADIERAIVEALKAMVMQDRPILYPRDILNQIQNRKAELARARKRVR
jgi:hypothetical protein